VEHEPFYDFLVLPVEGKLDPSPAFFCVAVVLMLRLVIHRLRYLSRLLSLLALPFSDHSQL
jgi:hypothetical protein